MVLGGGGGWLMVVWCWVVGGGGGGWVVVVVGCSGEYSVLGPSCYFLHMVLSGYPICMWWIGCYRVWLWLWSFACCLSVCGVDVGC